MASPGRFSGQLKSCSGVAVAAMDAFRNANANPWRPCFSFEDLQRFLINYDWKNGLNESFRFQIVNHMYVVGSTTSYH
jgi:hypothetical protein